MNDSCPQCAAPAGVGLIFCKNCGATLRPPTALTQSLAQGTSSVSQVRPWVRYWARMFDLSLFGLVAGLLIDAIFDPRAFSVTKRFGALGSQVIWQMILLFGWVFAESSLLSFLGRPPAKHYLGHGWCVVKANPFHIQWHSAAASKCGGAASEQGFHS